MVDGTMHTLVRSLLGSYLVSVVFPPARSSDGIRPLAPQRQLSCRQDTR